MKVLRKSISILFGLMICITSGAQQPPSGNIGEFGAKLYSEPTVSTRQEIINLLRQGFPSNEVFLLAISMGLPIDEILDAAATDTERYGEPEKVRDYVLSAETLLPYLRTDSADQYSRYNVGQTGYQVSSVGATEVVDRALLNQEAIEDTPPWYLGANQNHLVHGLSDFDRLRREQIDAGQWYERLVDVPGRFASSTHVVHPVFVSIYPRFENEFESRVLTDLTGESGSGDEIPVVYIFNEPRERAIIDFRFPLDLNEVSTRYREQGLYPVSTSWTV
ncbi:MAG: hypothetical protein HOM55_02530 [Proteobacteria bacterium]|jgi:hypothetical protein|nr:hypothetical protein [Pseudomonadota bacterium]